MKTMKRILIAMIALLPMAATAQKTSLTVNVNGLADGERIVLRETRGGRLVPTDTLTPDARHNIKVERETADPLFMAIGTTREKSAILHVLLLPKEKASMSVDYLPATDFLRIGSVKGSKNMELYRQYNNLIADVLEDTTLIAKLPERMEQLVGENPAELMSAFLVTYFDNAIEQYASLYREVRDNLISRYPDNGFVRHLDQKVKALGIVAGMEAPDIALPDTSGRVRRLSDLRGRVVLIDFWASWCGPCRMENPNVVRMYQKYHDKGFEIFSVSLDKERERWVAAIKKDNLMWPDHVSDLQYWNSAAGRLYGISSIPATVLVDRDGKVLARNLRGYQLEQKLQEIFGQ